jgi:hypothetical protein
LILETENCSKINPKLQRKSRQKYLEKRKKDKVKGKVIPVQAVEALRVAEG